MASNTKRTTKTTKGTSRTSAKRTTQAKVSSKSTPVMTERAEDAAIIDSSVSANTAGRRSLRANRLYIIIAVVVIALLALLYYFRGLFVVAMVNGQPISHIALIQQLENQDGQQVLNSLITETIIEQQAKKQGVSVSKQEVDQDEKQISDQLAKQGQNINQVLSMQGMTEKTLRDQLRVQKLIEKLLGKNVTVTDKEVSDYISQNKSTLPQNQSQAQLKATVESQLKQQKLNDKFQTWIQNQRQKANIQYFVSF